MKSGPDAGILKPLAIRTTRSGSPYVHSVLAGNTFGGGASARLPCGAPRSTHAAIVATSASLNDGSFAYSPMLRSICHGGISRLVTLVLIDRAQGRTSA